MRQRATHNMFRNWIFNGYSRLSGQVGYFIVPFAIGQCPPSPHLPISTCDSRRPVC